MRDDRNMRFLLLLTLTGALLSAQQPADSWDKATTLPAIDFSALSAAQKTAALKILRTQGCGCGCSMKVAECRVKDPACSVSRSLANLAVSELKSGKPSADVAKLVADAAAKGPGPQKLLEDPVSIPTAGDPFKGPAAAKITLVEFSDFQCPYCAAAAAKVDAIMKAYPKDIRLVFKQFPLDMHPQARISAQAALAAQNQGKFWELHDKMFANYRQLSRDRIIAMAREVGLDMTRFTADLENAKSKATINREIDEGVNFGVSGTPSFFINGKKYNGPIEAEALKPILEKELGH